MLLSEANSTLFSSESEYPWLAAPIKRSCMRFASRLWIAPVQTHRTSLSQQFYWQKNWYYCWMIMRKLSCSLVVLLSRCAMEKPCKGCVMSERKNLDTLSVITWIATGDFYASLGLVVCVRVGYPLNFLFILSSQASSECLISFYWEQIFVCASYAQNQTSHTAFCV